MRDIQFRGVRTDKEEFVYGSYVKATAQELGEDVPLAICRICHVIASEGEFFHIKPETLGQFTGEVDLNGNKIWEGDEVEYWNIYKNFSNAVEMYGVEPHTNWDINEVYADKCKGSVEFKDGKFSVNGVGLSGMGEAFREELIDLYYGERLDYGLKDFVELAHESGLRSPISRNCGPVVTGNIHS